MYYALLGRLPCIMYTVYITTIHDISLDFIYIAQTNMLYTQLPSIHCEMRSIIGISIGTKTKTQLGVTITITMSRSRSDHDSRHHDLGEIMAVGGGGGGGQAPEAINPFVNSFIHFYKADI